MGYFNPMKVIDVIIQKVSDAVKTGISLPWTKPWGCVPFCNAISRKPYRGINYFIAAMFGKGETLFITFNQARAAGGFIKAGAKGLPIVFFKRIPTNEIDANGKAKSFAMLRYFTVFALRDTEGLDKLRPAIVSDFKPIATAEEIAKRIDAPVIEGGNVACYSPREHTICMPSKAQFVSTQHYYCTLFHEAIHATAKIVGHDLSKNGGMGSESYSKEELIAEMGAAMLANAAGVWCEALEHNSTAYVTNWLKSLGSNPAMLVQAGSQAQKRVDYLLGIKAESEATPKDDETEGVE
jgi:antirestriction protein ArdC